MARLAVYFLLFAVTLILHISILPVGDLPLAVVLAVLFYIGIRPAFFFALAFGFAIDVFSPIFGLHLLAYPLVCVLASKVYAALLTDKSILSFSVLSVGSFIALWLLTGFSGFLGFSQTIRLFVAGLAAQVAFTAFLYFFGSHLSRRLSHGYAQ